MNIIIVLLLNDTQPLHKLSGQYLDRASRTQAI